MQKYNDYTFDFVINELKTKSIHDKYPYSNNKTNNKVINMSLGRIYFNECLPDDFPLINEPINQSKLTEISKQLVDKYQPTEIATTLSKLQKDFYQIGTLSPSTFTVDVFIPKQEWIDKKKEFEIKAVNYSPTEFQDEAKKLTQELVDDIESKGYRIHNILKGGIKGNPIDDWKNLLVGKGYIIDIEGNLLGPVVHGISEGFTKQEYFDSVAEARRGFYYKASLTAIPGYLARKLTMSSTNITLADVDCKTRQYYELYVTKENVNSITGRYIYEDGKLVLTDNENLKKYIGKSVKLRSPLYCQAKKNQICPICFGKLAEKLDTKQIGIMAAGVINLITLNALMKMRHKTSQIDAKEVDFNKILETTNIDKRIINDNLTVNKNTIVAKKPVSIIIDNKDYHISEILETTDYYQIPGILTLISQNNDSVTFPFDFQVKLYKTRDFEVDRNIITLNYEPDEIIIEQKFIIDKTDPSVIRKLFDAGFKYLNTPEMLCEMIFKQMPSDMCYIETIVQNMFRDKENPQNNCRLTHYKNCDIYSQKQLPFLNSWVNSLSFENIDKGIKKGLLSDSDIRYDPVEKIVIEKYLNE